MVFTCYAFYLKAFNLFSTGLTVRHVIMTITSERTGKSDLFDLTFRSDQLSDTYVTTSRQKKSVSVDSVKAAALSVGHLELRTLKLKWENDFNALLYWS